MAIKISDYKQTKHHGIKQHKATNNKYLLDFRIKNKRHRKNITANNLDAAYNQLLDAKAHIEKQYITSVNLDSTVNDYFELVCEIANWNSKTKKDLTNYYNNHIKKLLGDIPIKVIKSNTIVQFNKTCKNMTKRTHKKAYEILRPIFNQAIEDEIISASPIKKSHVPIRNSQEEKKFIQDASIKYWYIHEAIIQTFKERNDLKALFLFGLHGRRLKEVQHLRWSDINFMEDQYLIRRENSKVSQDMVFALPDEIREILSIMSIGVNQNDDVFPVKNINKYYEKIREHSALDEFSYHWMRNLAVTALFEQGVAFEKLSSFLGHTDGATLKKYLTMNRTNATRDIDEVTKTLLVNPMGD